MNKAKWVVHTKGGYTTQSYEVCVIRDDNEHGKQSYGWIGKDKIHIGCDGGPCRYNIQHKMIWDGLVELAHKVADHLNAEEAA